MAASPITALIAALFSVLIPARLWVAPNQPLEVTIKSDTPVNLILTDFTGKALEPKGSIEGASNKTVDLLPIYSQLITPGAYLLLAVPPGKANHEFVGTPLVISVRNDKRAGAPTNDVMVTRISPLRYGIIETDHGPMTAAFYYDAAPNTVEAIQRLADQGFFNGLTFHRIVPDFVIQGGDPKGDGTGGPGFQIDAEFNDKHHEEGVLSMARNGDPLEGQGRNPRCEYANSAGSQFFVCLSRKEHLDNRYTAFGKVVVGDAYKKIAAVPLADPTAGRPQKPPVIQKFEIRPVTSANNPYTEIMENLQPKK